MERGTCIIVVIAGLISLSTSAVADEKADKAIKELDQRFEKIKSYTAKIEAMTSAEFGPGHTHKSEMVGTTEWMRQDKKALIHTEMKYKNIETKDSKTTTTPSTLLTVNDGEFLYILEEKKGEKTVMKNQPTPLATYTPTGCFRQYAAYYDIKRLDDAKFGGDVCYVFELKMKPMEGAPPSGRQLLYFQKDHGFQVKSETFDADGKLTGSSILKDIKINVGISADRFKFTVPKDARVVDNTKPYTPTTPTETEAAKKSEKTEKDKEDEKEETKEKKIKGIKLPKKIKLP